MTALSGSYDYRPVALCIALAMSASYAALHLAGGMTAAQVWARAVFHRFRTIQTGDLSSSRKHELYFKTMSEAVPEIMWTAGPDGADDYFNRRWFDYTGLTFEQSRGTGWTVAVHPDDLGPFLEKWEKARRRAQPYTVEYRLRGADGTYRWFVCRGNPIRDLKGDVVKWFGTCSDIEDQKQNQQILEQQILERTMQLADANTRLQEEMLEKDSARKELDQQTDRMLRELEERSSERPCWRRWENCCRAVSVWRKFSRPLWALRPGYFPPPEERWHC